MAATLLRRAVPRRRWRESACTVRAAGAGRHAGLCCALSRSYFSWFGEANFGAAPSLRRGRHRPRRRVLSAHVGAHARVLKSSARSSPFRAACAIGRDTLSPYAVLLALPGVTVAVIRAPAPSRPSSSSRVYQERRTPLQILPERAEGRDSTPWPRWPALIVVALGWGCVFAFAMASCAPRSTRTRTPRPRSRSMPRAGDTHDPAQSACCRRHAQTFRALAEAVVLLAAATSRHRWAAVAGAHALCVSDHRAVRAGGYHNAGRAMRAIANAGRVLEPTSCSPPPMLLCSARSLLRRPGFANDDATSSSNGGDGATTLYYPRSSCSTSSYVRRTRDATNNAPPRARRGQGGPQARPTAAPSWRTHNLTTR